MSDDDDDTTESGGKRKFPCLYPQCTRSYAKRSTMRDHMITDHRVYIPNNLDLQNPSQSMRPATDEEIRELRNKRTDKIVLQGVNRHGRRSAVADGSTELGDVTNYSKEDATWIVPLPTIETNHLNGSGSKSGAIESGLQAANVVSNYVDDNVMWIDPIPSAGTNRVNRSGNPSSPAEGHSQSSTETNQNMANPAWTGTVSFVQSNSFNRYSLRGAAESRVSQHLNVSNDSTGKGQSIHSIDPSAESVALLNSLALKMSHTQSTEAHPVPVVLEMSSGQLAESSMTTPEARMSIQGAVQKNTEEHIFSISQPVSLARQSHGLLSESSSITPEGTQSAVRGRTEIRQSSKRVGFGTGEGSPAQGLEQWSVTLASTPAVTYCDHHPIRMLDLYCYDCKMATCFVCFSEKHKSHTCCDIAKAADTFRGHLDDDILNVTTCVALSQQKLQQLSVVRESFLKSMECTEKLIVQEFNELQALMELHRDRFRGQLCALRDAGINEIETRKMEIESHFEVMEIFRRYCQEIAENGTANDISGAAGDLRTRANELVMSQDELMNSKLSAVEMTLIPSRVTMNRVKSLIGKLFSKTDPAEEDSLDAEIALIAQSKKYPAGPFLSVYNDNHSDESDSNIDQSMYHAADDSADQSDKVEGQLLNLSDKRLSCRAIKHGGKNKKKEEASRSLSQNSIAKANRYPTETTADESHGKLSASLSANNLQINVASKLRSRVTGSVDTLGTLTCRKEGCFTPLGPEQRETKNLRSRRVNVTEDKIFNELNRRDRQSTPLASVQSEGKSLRSHQVHTIENKTRIESTGNKRLSTRITNNRSEVNHTGKFSSAGDKRKYPSSRVSVQIDKLKLSNKTEVTDVQDAVDTIKTPSSNMRTDAKFMSKSSGKANIKGKRLRSLLSETCIPVEPSPSSINLSQEAGNASRVSRSQSSRTLFNSSLGMSKSAADVGHVSVSDNVMDVDTMSQELRGRTSATAHNSSANNVKKAVSKEVPSNLNNVDDNALNRFGNKMSNIVFNIRATTNIEKVSVGLATNNIGAAKRQIGGANLVAFPVRRVNEMLKELPHPIESIVLWDAFKRKFRCPFRGCTSVLPNWTELELRHLIGKHSCQLVTLGLGSNRRVTKVRTPTRDIVVRFLTYQMSKDPRGWKGVKLVEKGKRFYFDRSARKNHQVVRNSTLSSAITLHGIEAENLGPRVLGTVSHEPISDNQISGQVGGKALRKQEQSYSESLNKLTENCDKASHHTKAQKVLDQMKQISHRVHQDTKPDGNCDTERRRVNQVSNIAVKKRAKAFTNQFDISPRRFVGTATRDEILQQLSHPLESISLLKNSVGKYQCPFTGCAKEFSNWHRLASEHIVTNHYCRLVTQGIGPARHLIDVQVALAEDFAKCRRILCSPVLKGRNSARSVIDNATEAFDSFNHDSKMTESLQGINGVVRRKIGPEKKSRRQKATKSLQGGTNIPSTSKNSNGDNIDILLSASSGAPQADTERSVQCIGTVSSIGTVGGVSHVQHATTSKGIPKASVVKLEPTDPDLKFPAQMKDLTIQLKRVSVTSAVIQRAIEYDRRSLEHSSMEKAVENRNGNEMNRQKTLVATDNNLVENSEINSKISFTNFDDKGHDKNVVENSATKCDQNLVEDDEIDDGILVFESSSQDCEKTVGGTRMDSGKTGLENNTISYKSNDVESSSDSDG